MSACSALSEVAAPIRPRLELAEIFRSHGEHYRTEYSVAPEQAKAMRDIQACRTAALGGHLDVCDEGCGYQRISYNSCRNRHCPKCQGLQSARWLEKRFDKVLPTPYFHMVFTIPHELVGITLQNRKTLYNILFRAAAQSLLQLAQEWERLRAHIGFTAILHTWSQDSSSIPTSILWPRAAAWISQKSDGSRLETTFSSPCAHFPKNSEENSSTSSGRHSTPRCSDSNRAADIFSIPVPLSAS